MTHQTNHNTPDHLDSLLREWHDENATAARANRDALMSRLAREDKGVVARIGDADDSPEANPRRPLWARTAAWLPVAASLAIMVSLVAFMMGGGGANGPRIASRADNKPAPANSMESLRAGGFIQQASFIPEGGRLDAIDNEGQIVGTCPLKHTAVTATIQGKFARVSVKQQYANPYADKIEAVYTFPLSNNSAVDRMTMTIGDRVIVGEVKERTVARNIYEQARSQGRTAALLEQERPNIFTQSVANIEPGAQITIEISYLELIKSNEGEYSFTFPMTVAPRYIPGYASGAPVDFHFQLPAGLDPRPGDIFLGQAAVDATSGRLSSGQVDALMQNAIAIQSPVRDMSDLNERMTNRRKADFVATYADGSKEVGIIFDDNTGALNNRWFYCPIEPGLQPHLLAEQPALLAKKIQPSEGGAPFASDTDQVPDASRITPTPTRPEVRAGHDISIEVNLQTGGPGITSLDSVLHEIDRTDLIKPNDFTAPVGALIHLKDKNTIPNKDFVLKWRLNDESIENQVFSYNGEKGGFLTLSMLPPARTPFTETIAVPRELIFVLDTSGSMSGFPIEKAKEVMTRAISQMRTFDAFNVITFAGATRILWDEPRQATEENIALANAFVNNQSGNGGTEMMSAINAALSQTVNKPKRQWLTPEQLLDAPINGDEVTLRVRMTGREYLSIEGHQQFQVPANHMRTLSATVEHWTVKLGIVDPDSVVTLELKGRYLADDRDAPEFIVSHAGLIPNDFITAEALLNLPADGRRIELLINSFTTAHDPLFQTSDESIQPLSQWVRHLRMTARIIENEFRKATIVGRWTTQNAQRVFVMEQWGGQPIQSTRPVRICMFLTDGQVGNDHAIIEAVKQNAGTTRVFSFGVGNAPNRYLLDGIALAGRGAADYVTLADGADPIVDRFTTRIQTLLLSDVSIEFNTPMPMLDIVSPNVMGELQHPRGAQRHLPHARPLRPRTHHPPRTLQQQRQHRPHRHRHRPRPHITGPIRARHPTQLPRPRTRRRTRRAAVPPPNTLGTRESQPTPRHRSLGPATRRAQGRYPSAGHHARRNLLHHDPLHQFHRRRPRPRHHRRQTPPRPCPRRTPRRPVLRGNLRRRLPAVHLHRQQHAGHGRR
ncbi:MAG: VIT domain-containing protein [Phycisphaerales bacterium]